MLQIMHGVHLQVVGVIAAALEQHAAHSVLNQHGPLSVGMQAASGVSETTAAQQADPTACAASANNDVSAITMEVRCTDQAILDPFLGLCSHCSSGLYTTTT